MFTMGELRVCVISWITIVCVPLLFTNCHDCGFITSISHAKPMTSISTPHVLGSSSPIHQTFTPLAINSPTFGGNTN